MKLRSIALAGAALAALSAPAMASDYTGWYLGAGIGYSDPLLVHVSSPAGTAKIAYNADVLGVLSAGYKWDYNIRTEIELGYAGYSTHQDTAFGPGGGGGIDVKSALFNVSYDLPLGQGFAWTIGAGAGGGGVLEDSKLNGVKAIHGQQVGFMWQGMSGFSLALSPAVDFYADWRYRDAEVDSDYESDITGVAPVHVKSVQSNTALIGLRWYLEPPMAAPPRPSPPPPPPPPPPAPPPPPMVKTFIVFFDFDKSNLTEKAQEVVSEAVKAAKTQGMVKVMVTGHTDTVGSDTYNQALSERRAQSVKDEMVREGLDGGTIAIEGKSFHDPLVPTGPGVREPQNRRAVIDLGG
jgi:OmpA-OmpF porin, OOP family